MIHHLNGKLVEKHPTLLIIECGGVGYEVKISLNTFSVLTDNEAIHIYTRQVIREDAHVLYGFATKEEREMFGYLTSVSGVGATTAMIMLSSLTPDQVVQAIQTDDVRLIQSIKGIGTKTAQRLIVDLKDKVLKISLNTENIFATNNTNRFDALTALLSLGFDKKNVEKALDKVTVGDQSVEELIKEALKTL